MAEATKPDVVTLGGGCFWCLEAVFEQLRGVSRVESGYAGGTAPAPTYQQVCTGSTGHAEVVQFQVFHKAEAYHQEYFRTNPGQPYCQAVVAPKVAKFRKHFVGKLRS